MTFDEQKLSYIHLLLDEPIYVVKDDKETAVLVHPIETIGTNAPPATIAPPPAQAQLRQPQPHAPHKQTVTKNKSKVLVLFFNDQSAYLKKNEEALLQKILAALQLRIDDVELLNYNNIRQIEYMDFLKDKVLHHLISFGIPLTELNLDIHLIKYKAEKIEGIHMLLADSLGVLEHDMDLKKQLWKSLQQMFMK